MKPELVIWAKLARVKKLEVRNLKGWAGVNEDHW